MNTNNGRRNFLGALLSSVFYQGCGGGSGGSSASSADLSGGVAASDNLIAAPEVIQSALYIAHRGSAAIYPEETYVGYDGSALYSDSMLECDVQMLKDGVLALMHDYSLDRTTDGTGRLNQINQQQLKFISVDGDIWHGSNYGKQAVPLFAEWVERYKDKAVLVPEDKDWASMPSMLRVLDDAKVEKKNVLLQCFYLPPLKLAVAAGYPACFLDEGTTSPTVLSGTGINWAGIASTAADTQLEAWIASGVSILVYTVNRRNKRDVKLRQGVKGFFSDDPVYLRNNEALSTQDRFELKQWMPGMLGSVTDLDSVSRGKFFADGYWGYDTTTSGYFGCLQGYLCPVKGNDNLRTYELELNVKFGAALDDDDTRWASTFIGIDDRAFIDANDASSGYHFLFRKSGAIEVFRKENGKSAVWLAAVTGPRISDAEEVTFRMTFSRTAIFVARLSSSGEVRHQTQVNDNGTKGGYIQLGRNGLACKFRKISVK